MQGLDKFFEIAKPMISQPIIYVEGNYNKVFYQSLRELEDKFIENGYSCINIKTKLITEEDSYGIIDHDYQTDFDDRIFPIDYYSLENLSLKYMEEFSDLREKINSYLSSNNLEDIKYFNHKLYIFRNEEKRISDYQIVKDCSIHNQYNNYLDNNVICKDSFMRYGNLKKVIERYVSIYKSLKAENKKLNHLTDLANRIAEPSVNVIFDAFTLSKFHTTFNEAKVVQVS